MIHDLAQSLSLQCRLSVFLKLDGFVGHEAINRFMHQQKSSSFVALRVLISTLVGARGKINLHFLLASAAAVTSPRGSAASSGPSGHEKSHLR